MPCSLVQRTSTGCQYVQAANRQPYMVAKPTFTPSIIYNNIGKGVLEIPYDAGEIVYAVLLLRGTRCRLRIAAGVSITKNDALVAAANGTVAVDNSADRADIVAIARNDVAASAEEQLVQALIL